MTILAATCWPQVPPERVREVARAAEDSGLAELWLWEDCFWGGAMSLASAILAWTDRLTVATGVLPVPLRNVALTAMEAATLHRLFPGRITIGVGHGVQGWMGQVGARAESPVTLLTEYLQALRGLLAGERLTVEGRYVRLEDVALGWPPHTTPAILTAARGPRTLQVSGQFADGTIVDSAATADDLRAARRAIDEGRAAAGRTDPHQVVIYLLTVTGPDAAQRLAAMGRLGAAAAGDAEQVAEAVRLWAKAGADKVVLYPDLANPDPVSFVRFAAEQVQPLLDLRQPLAAELAVAALPGLGPLAVGGGEPVVDQRDQRRDERRHHGAGDQVGDEAAPRDRQGEQDEREHDLAAHPDQEGHDERAEHVPGVAADRPPAPLEGVNRAGPADHDLRHEQRPEGDQDQPRHDEEEQADSDADAREDRRHGDRAHERPGGRDGRAEVEVDAPVPDVLHGGYQRRLQQEHADQADDPADDHAEAAERPAEQGVDDGDD